MTADELRAIRERLELATKFFLDAIEHDLAQNPPKTITEAVIISRFYPSAFEDIARLLAEVERLQATWRCPICLTNKPQNCPDHRPHTGPALAAKIGRFNGRRE